MRDESTSPEYSEQLTSLVERWCNRQIDEGEVRRLEEILLESRAARRFYRRYMNLHAGLHQRCEGDDVLQAIPVPAVRRAGWTTWGGWALAAVLTVLFVVWNFVGQTGEPGPGTTAAAEAVPRTVGLMVNESGARFAGVDRGAPIQFEPGVYELEAGIVHFRLTNGVDVVMRGPARFGIEDAMRMTLDSGIVRAIVPDSGQGFTIVAPGMHFEDLGTEFGLSVEDGRNEMYVFTGQVNARMPGQGEIVSSVFEGESFRQDGAEVKVDRSGPGVQFPSPEDVGYEGWMAQQPDVLVPEGLIAYFPFTADPDDPEVLRNVVVADDGSKRVPDGRVEGARWVSGRWSEKDALLFDRSGDRVRVEIPGEFDAISMSVWINVDRLDFAVNAIFTSDGWSPGALHWQMLRTQDPILAVHEIYENGPLLQRAIRLGRWIHLVAVLSRESGRTRYYVDGQLAQENQLPADALIAPGRGMLGDWLQEAYDPYPKRSLRARIDEFAIWDRALTPSEIVEMTRSGAPSMLTLADRLVPVPAPVDGARFPGGAGRKTGR